MKIKMIRDIEDLEKIFKKARAMILKDSPRCPVSRTARRTFEKFAEEYGDRIDLYMVDVIENKDISDKIAEKTEIKHKSPQIILMVNGEVTWHASHGEIKSEKLAALMKT